MIKKAFRADAATLAQARPEINNRVTLQAAGSDCEKQELLSALEAVVEASANGPYVSEAEGFRFGCEWEPPFKALRAFAKKFPTASFTLLSDAFASGCWIARAEYKGGDVTSEETLTFIDGDRFETVFREIHGMNSTEWRKRFEGTTGPVRGGFAWGAVEGFDASKSELGKAEGQL